MAPRNRNSYKVSGGSTSTYTRAQFRAEFSDDATCLEWLKNRNYPDGITCATCDKVTPHYRVKSRPSYSCQFCGHHVHPLAGTIFEKSSTSLVLWFEAVFLMSSTRCGISAKQLEREIGVTYKTAWRMFRLIRPMLSDDDETRLSGAVEMDEPYFTRSKRNRGEPKHQSKSPGERVVVGAVERGGRVVARHVPSATAAELETHARTFVMPGSTIYTDEYKGYSDLPRSGFAHQRIKHSQKVYTKGDIHTQTIENFWMTLKGGIIGVYHAVGTDYVQSYIDEYAFRYNRRWKGYPMFRALLDRASGGVAVTG